MKIDHNNWCDDLHADIVYEKPDKLDFDRVTYVREDLYDGDFKYKKEPETSNGPPKAIWLQWHGDDVAIYDYEDQLDYEDITWSDRAVFSRDIHYIRADEYGEAIAMLAKLQVILWGTRTEITGLSQADFDYMGTIVKNATENHKW